MAIIKCQECGREISDTADFCPHCGWNLKQKRKERAQKQAQKELDGCLSLVVKCALGLIIVGVISLIFFPEKPEVKKCKEECNENPYYDQFGWYTAGEKRNKCMKSCEIRYK